MIRKIGWCGSYSWGGDGPESWGCLDSESWVNSKSGSEVWNSDRGLTRCWSSFSCWCWVWSGKRHQPVPKSRSWGNNR